MNQIPELDLEDERRREEAGVLLLRLGLALIDDARHGEGFETDEDKLAARVDEILDELGATSSNSDEAPVRATPQDRDRVLLSTPTGERGSDSALLRIDGILLDEYTSIAISAEAVDTTDLSPEQLEELRQAKARYEALMQRPRFRGECFRRALAVDPQPGSDIHILAAELYEDGLIVHYTFDDDPELTESRVSGDLPESLDRGAEISLEDDLGTEFFESGGVSGGVQVFHGALAFAPAVPIDAKQLRISSRSGTVELNL
jgi:hypothetical protein